MRLFALLLMSFLVSCQSIHTRTTTKRAPSPTQKGTSQSSPSSQVDSQEMAYEEEEQAPQQPEPEIPKVGIILGGGGAKTFAHISFLKEVQRMRIPVIGIAGIEWGAPIALLYAQNQRANDVEWQMLKLKDESFLKTGGLFNRQQKALDISRLGLWQDSFGKVRMDRLDLVFTCPVNNFKKNDTYVVSKGQAPSVLNYCVGYPPIFEPAQDVVAGLREVEMVAEYLRQKGANYIVFVNVLGEPSTMQFAHPSDKVLWAETASRYRKPFKGVDLVVSLKSGNYGIVDFAKKREIISQANESAKTQVQELAKKWGL